MKMRSTTSLQTIIMRTRVTTGWLQLLPETRSGKSRRQLYTWRLYAPEEAFWSKMRWFFPSFCWSEWCFGPHFLGLVYSSRRYSGFEWIRLLKVSWWLFHRFSKPSESIQTLLHWMWWTMLDHLSDGEKPSVFFLHLGSRMLFLGDVWKSWKPNYIF